LISKTTGIKNISVAILALSASITLFGILLFSSELKKSYENYLDQQIAIEKNIIKDLSTQSEMIGELVFIGSARFLEDARILSKSESDSIVQDSLDKLNIIAPRINELLIKVNNAYIDSRR